MSRLFHDRQFLGLRNLSMSENLTENKSESSSLLIGKESWLFLKFQQKNFFQRVKIYFFENP